MAVEKGRERTARVAERGWKVKDDDTDRVLGSRACSLPLRVQAFFSASSRSGMGGTRWPLVGLAGARSGLCVVINGNLKQRELTISFFISSPTLRAQEAPTERDHPHAPSTPRVESGATANTRTWQGRGRVVFSQGGKRKRGAIHRKGLDERLCLSHRDIPTREPVNQPVSQPAHVI